MHFLLLAVILQASPITLQKAPSTVTPQATQKPHISVPQIESTRNASTPDLDPNTEETHTRMAEDIGEEKEAISTLKTNVSDLSEKREHHDRPDIDDLIASRFHLRLEEGVIAGILTIVAAILWWAKDFLWNDTIKPRLRRHLVDPPESNPS
jgi:hypothetical protein